MSGASRAPQSWNQSGQARPGELGSGKEGRHSEQGRQRGHGQHQRAPQQRWITPVPPSHWLELAGSQLSREPKAEQGEGQGGDTSESKLEHAAAPWVSLWP